MEIYYCIITLPALAGPVADEPSLFGFVTPEKLLP
jgi:hypothetical protein